MPGTRERDLDQEDGSRSSVVRASVDGEVERDQNWDESRIWSGVKLWPEVQALD